MNWYKKIVAESHKYSTVMLEIKGDLRKRIFEHIHSLDEDDIAKDGKEDNPHVTVLYGLHAEDPEEIADFLSAMNPFEISFGKVSKFKSDEHDVLKIEIESDYIKTLNKKLKDFPHTSTHPTYNPHLTLAYVKNGRCEDMLGKELFKGEKFKVNELIFCDKKENQTLIILEGG